MYHGHIKKSIKSPIMNTYNENLQSAVVSSLQAQGLDQKTVQSKVNASMFTLYYAEGATITARENLEIALKDMLTAAIVKEVAVDNSNLSNNLLSSATQGSQYAALSNSNTSVAAANVQLAANAVVKLSCDIGSIFSIVSSADFGTEIHMQAKEARQLMDNTAYNAELASQLALEACIESSAVSASTVLDRAKSTNGQMNNLLKVLSTDFDNAAQLVATDNATRAAKSTAEKVAEGDFEDVSADYKASFTAYNSLNRSLNLNLRVPFDTITATGFTVKFRAIKSPFERDKAVAYYPVQNYYVIVVKESKQFTFSISAAEYVLMNQPKRFVPVTLPAKASPTVEVPIDINDFSDDEGSYVLQDSDGDAITTGTNYVVYVMAVYLDEFKRKINVFDDFLSAASRSFVLTNALNAAQGLIVSAPANDNTLTLTFTTDNNPDFKIDYRCMFLLKHSELSVGLLSQKSVEAIKADIEILEEIAEQFDPQIDQLEARLSQLHQQQVVGNTDASGDDETQLQQELDKAVADRQAAISKVVNETPSASQIGFVFNLDIAEQVPAANYTVAAPAPGQRTNSNSVSWQVTIGPATTDNFGNLLLPGKHYIPVVLTMSVEEEVNLSRFTNALTDFDNTQSFAAPSLPANTN
jgi:hypothetical protein